MSESGRPSNLLLYAMMILVVIVAVYLGGYYAMLAPMRLIRADGSVSPAYRFWHPESTVFFHPAYLLDEAIRPTRWQPGASYPGVGELDVRSIRLSETR